MAIIINNTLSIAESEVEISAIRSQGSGGQNVNKVATAVHLRFDIAASSLPAQYKERLLAKKHHNITEGGIVIIKAQQYRSQAKNRELALLRLIHLIRSIEKNPKKRLPSKTTKAAREKRLKRKNIRSTVKNLRRKVDTE